MRSASNAISSSFPLSSFAFSPVNSNVWSHVGFSERCTCARAQHNAAHLYAHVVRSGKRGGVAVEPAQLKQRALHYFKLAALQGSQDAQVQLANMLADDGDFTSAARLYKEAGRAGNKDALFALGGLYWGGKGVEKSMGTAWALWQSAEFQSKHAQLRGMRAAFFRTARFVLEFRALFLLAAGLFAIVSTGGNPIDIVRGAMGGGQGQPAHGGWEEDFEDDDDLFGAGADADDFGDEMEE